MENKGVAKKRQHALGEIHQAQHLNKNTVTHKVYRRNNKVTKKKLSINKTRTLDKFSVLYTNADQLPNKYDDLLTLIAGNEPDIIIITEVLPKLQKYPTYNTVIMRMKKKSQVALEYVAYPTM